MTLYTVGHGTLDEGALGTLLAEARVVDGALRYDGGETQPPLFDG